MSPSFDSCIYDSGVFIMVRISLDESNSLDIMEESMVVGDVIMEKSNSPDNVGYLCCQFLTAVYMNQVSYCGPFLA